MGARIGRSVERRLLTLLVSFSLVPIAALAYLAFRNGAEPVVFGSVVLFSQIAMGVVIVSLLAIFWVSVRVLRSRFEPLIELEEVTRRVARDDYSRRVRINNRDEFQ